MHKLILTFDIEDFINPNEIAALQTILELLDKQKLRALFFITGHMAEKLTAFPIVMNLLEKHEIGFHSSGHSVRPIISEFTDVESYAQARAISLERETSHINPLTGEAEGEGGIYLLQDLFHHKKIEAFRAPGMSWTPPHLEALGQLGIKFDFSSNITMTTPVYYKGVTFYPYTFTQEWEGSLSDYEVFLSAISRRKVAVFDLHPTQYVNKLMWDSVYQDENPTTLARVPERPEKEAASFFRKFESLLKLTKLLQKANLIDANPSLHESSVDPKIGKKDVQKFYEWSMRWPRKFFHYNPTYVRAHFQQFFEETCQY